MRVDVGAIEIELAKGPKWPLASATLVRPLDSGVPGTEKVEAQATCGNRYGERGCFLVNLEQLPGQKVEGLEEHQIHDPAMIPMTRDRKILMVKNSILGMICDELVYQRSRYRYSYV